MEELNVKLGADARELTPDLEKAKAGFKKYADDVSNSLGKAAVASSRSGQSAKAAGIQFQGFSRVLQDAAFGPAAIANNFEGLGRDIQQLKQISKDTGQSIGKTLVQSLTGGGGLNLALGAVTLGLSLASFGMSAWTRLFPKNADEVDKAKKKTLEYIDTLDDVRKSQLQGSQDAVKELGTLKMLYKQYTDANLPLEQRKRVYKELQAQYPSYFGNLKFEQEASAKTKGAYDKLTTSILATSKARAAADIITKNSTRQLENEQKIIDLEKEKLKLLETQKKARDLLNAQGQSASSTGASTGNIVAERKLYNANKAVEDVQRKINNLKTDSNILTERNLRLDEQISVEVANGAKLTGGFGDAVDKSTEKVKKAKAATKEWMDLMFAKNRDEAFKGLNTNSAIPSSNLADLTRKTQSESFKLLQEDLKLFLSITAEEFNNWVYNIGNNLTSAFGNFFADILTTGKISFKSLGDSILNEFKRILANAITKKLLGLFMNFATGGGSGILGSVFKFLGGSIPGFASGVTNFSGGLALVGEQGPELVNLPGGSDVIPNGKFGMGGSQVFIARTAIRGSDIQISYDRAAKTNSRII